MNETTKPDSKSGTYVVSAPSEVFPVGFLHGAVAGYALAAMAEAVFGSYSSQDEELKNSLAFQNELMTFEHLLTNPSFLPNAGPGGSVSLAFSNYGELETWLKNFSTNAATPPLLASIAKSFLSTLQSQQGSFWAAAAKVFNNRPSGSQVTETWQAYAGSLTQEIEIMRNNAESIASPAQTAASSIEQLFQGQGTVSSILATSLNSLLQGESAQ